MKAILSEFIKYIVLVTGAFDAYKYRFLAQKVARLKSSREISRKFILTSIINRLFLLIYAWWILNDWVITVVSFVAIYTMFEALYYAYLYYPYRNRGLKNFKRPSIWLFIWDSIRPNRRGKKL